MRFNRYLSGSQFIAKAIRDMYQVEKILFNRSISLPPRYPETHYKLYHVSTGPKYELCTRFELWNRMGLVQDAPPVRNHWRSLTERLSGKIYNRIHLIGAAPRFNLYSVRKRPLNWVDTKVSRVYAKGRPCECIPPCECQWLERHYCEPWVLQCLIDAKLAAKANEEIIVVTAPMGPPEQVGEVVDKDSADKRKKSVVISILKLNPLNASDGCYCKCDCEQIPPPEGDAAAPVTK